MSKAARPEAKHTSLLHCSTHSRNGHLTCHNHQQVTVKSVSTPVKGQRQGNSRHCVSLKTQAAPGLPQEGTYSQSHVLSKCNTQVPYGSNLPQEGTCSHSHVLPSAQLVRHHKAAHTHTLKPQQPQASSSHQQAHLQRHQQQQQQQQERQQQQQQQHQQQQQGQW